jgi:predicted metal-dependent hydrolase
VANLLEARELQIGDAVISYSLRRTRRQRTIAIVVEPNQAVTVLSPQGTDLTTIERILRRRMPWIRRQRRELETLPPAPSPRAWVNGETHRYLGRQYRLKLVTGVEDSVRCAGPFLLVTLPEPKDRHAVQQLVEAWYRTRARLIVGRRAERLLNATTWLNIPKVPPITIKVMRRRWGSTTNKGRIMFNVDVVKLSPACLDYVIAHELVHVRIPNHSPAYWRMLTRIMPDWKRWRDRLRNTEI